MTKKPKRKRTQIRFAVQETVYQAGTGSRTEWVPIKVKIGTDERGNDIETDSFFCEWLGSYGATAIRQQADGVIRPARVRMTFVQTLYDALTTKDVRIYKNGVIDDAHRYRLASAADNCGEENKTLEFQVEKYEKNKSVGQFRKLNEAMGRVKEKIMLTVDRE